MRRTQTIGAGIGAALLTGTLAASTPAAATPGSGVSTSDVVLGTLEGPARAAQDGVSLRVRGDVTVRAATVTYAVGGYSGWHRHPGIVLTTVVQGTVVRRVGCGRPEVFTVGQSFTEVEPHFVRNYYVDAAEPHAVAAILRGTQIFPSGATPREEVEPPRCRY